MTDMHTTTDTVFHGLSYDISSLTARDVGIAVSSCWEYDDCWSDDCYDALHAAATEVLRSARTARTGKRGAALEAVASRLGFLTAALMDPAACAAWNEAKRTLRGCYGEQRAATMLRIVAIELMLSQPTYH